MHTNNTEPICTTCYQIACKKCSWIASDIEVEQIQQGLLSACPLCGWKPGEN